MKAENKNINKATTTATTTRDTKDVVIGIFFLFFGFFFFVLMTFWIIISKIITVPSSKVDEFPIIIKFFIRDEHYAFVITLFLPVLIIMFYCRRIAFNYFRHSF